MDGWNSWKIRVVLLGESRVGKSTLVQRAAGRPLLVPLTPTIGIDYDNVHLKTGGECFTLQLWDTAGQERFRSIVDGYYRGAACLLLCVASDSMSSLTSLKTYWYPKVHSSNPGAKCVVVLTKADCGTGQVAKLTRAWANEHGLPVFTVDALHRPVEPLMQWIATTCRTSPPPAGVTQPMAHAVPPAPPAELKCCCMS